MKFHRITSLFAVVSLCTALVTPAAADAFLRISGSKDTFKGGATLKGREGTSLLLSFDQSVTSPRDAATGLATGRRQHKPLVLTKEIDGSSIGLQQALTNNEKLKEVTVEVWQPTGKGADAKVFTIALKNAFVAGVRHLQPAADGSTSRVIEEVTFVYESITWTAGNASTADTWDQAKP